MAVHPLLPDPAVLTLDSLAIHNGIILFAARAAAPGAACPCCGWLSERLHSRYRRTLLDLPWQGNAVRIVLSVRKFFCDNRQCERRIFAERFPVVASRYARKTCRLAEALRELAYLGGGEAAARIARAFGLMVSPDALLESLRRPSLPTPPIPRVLGVDDFAFKRGRVYGTILVDLERRCPVDLLPDREADTLCAWLQEHPGVEVISRDRGNTYIEGATQGAPDAVQVADRWHLLHNLKGAVEELLMRHRNQLLRTATQTSAPSCAAISSSSSSSAPVRSALSLHEKTRLAKRDTRLERYGQVVALKERGKSVSEIAQVVGVSKRTISRFLATGLFPERRRRRRSPSPLDPYLPYLKERFEAGCHKGMQLWREIAAQGYAGPLASIYPVLARLREGLPLLPGDPPACTGPPTKTHYSVREAVWLLLRQPADLGEIERGDLDEMRRNCPDIATAYALSQEFQRIVRLRQLPALADWLEAASACKVGELARFAAGLRQDRAAVEAALSLCWSNGQTEGQVNRLKMLKRQMYGRASFELLRARVLPFPAAVSATTAATAAMA